MEELLCESEDWVLKPPHKTFRNPLAERERSESEGVLLAALRTAD